MKFYATCRRSRVIVHQTVQSTVTGYFIDGAEMATGAVRWRVAWRVPLIAARPAAAQCGAARLREHRCRPVSHMVSYKMAERTGRR